MYTFWLIAVIANMAKDDVKVLSSVSKWITSTHQQHSRHLYNGEQLLEWRQQTHIFITEDNILLTLVIDFFINIIGDSEFLIK